MLNERSEPLPPVSEALSLGMQAVDADSLARSKVTKLWQPADLFHNFSRFPEKPDAPRVDRLAQILTKGLIAPASCDDDTVCSDLNIVVIGAAVPYDSLVFLHRFGRRSGLYLSSRPGRFTVLVEPAVPVLTPEDMGSNWIITCADEVYVRDRIASHHLSGLVVHPADADVVIKDFCQT